MSDSTIIQLNKLLALLPDIIKDVEYSELYGYNLNTLPDTPTGTVIRDRLLTKFLVANKFVISEAASQLKKTLAWRRDFNPLSAAFSETHDPEFEQLSVTTSVPIPQAHVAPIKTASSVVTKTATTSDVTADVDAAKKKSNELEVPAAAPAVEEHISTVSEEATKPVAEAEETAEASTEPIAEITEANAEPVAESTEAVSDLNETTEAIETNDNTTTAEALVNENSESAPQLIMTWNLYGAVKNRKQLFSDLEGFLRWRVGIMERSIALLDFSSIETSYIVQLHDYHNVSFIFLDSPTKAASKATIELFQNYYPEFLNVKYFVNIPIVMSWLYSFVKLLVSKETSDKFRVIANGADLAATAGNWVPKKYGGIADGFDEIAVKQIEPIDATLIDAPRPEKKVKPATKTDSTTEAVETAEASEPTEASKAVEIAEDSKPADDAKSTNADESASKANIAEDSETALKTDIPEVTDAKAEPKVATVSSTNEPTTTTTAVSATVPDSPTETTAAKVAEHKTAEPAVVSEPPTDTVVTTAADANGINIEAAAPPAPIPGNDTLDDTAAKPTAA
ncbi:hypothetical protein D0Z03_000301 [Geotrichum reessii]|nr:hypothetical protein D0Z03_000301 [Galactomyces reessii]